LLRKIRSARDYSEWDLLGFCGSAKAGPDVSLDDRYRGPKKMRGCKGCGHCGAEPAPSVAVALLEGCHRPHDLLHRNHGQEFEAFGNLPPEARNLVDAKTLDRARERSSEPLPRERTSEAVGDGPQVRAVLLE
jgi:hypothetical protein